MTFLNVRAVLWVAVLALLSPVAVSAQTGTVEYTVTTKLEFTLPPEAAHMQDQFPTESTSARVLVFDETEALTRNAPSDDEAQPAGFTSPTGERVVLRLGGSSSDNQTYVDLETAIVTEKREFLGRTFRITGEREALAWRLTGEQGEFLGYPCQKAVAVRDSTTLEAWFTSQIPVSAGPETYGGLPGLILVLTDGRRTYEATSVGLEPLAEDAIEAPTGGREVTREQFDTIVEEKMEEIRSSRSQRGRRGIPVIRLD